VPRKRASFAEARDRAAQHISGSPRIGEILGDDQEPDSAGTRHIIDIPTSIRFAARHPAWMSLKSVRDALDRAGAKPTPETRSRPRVRHRRCVIKRRPRKVPMGAHRARAEAIVLEHLMAVHAMNLHGARGPTDALRVLERWQTAELSAAHRGRRQGKDPGLAHRVEVAKARIASTDIAEDENAERYLLRVSIPRLLTEQEALRLHRNITVRALSECGATPGFIAALFKWDKMRGSLTRENAKKILSRPDRQAAARISL
jgi:hypothetical protein